MTHCIPRSTPCEINVKFDNDGEPVDLKRYSEVIGSLINMMTGTLPDFQASLLVKCHNMVSIRGSNEQPWVAAKHVLRCLKGTADLECNKKSDVNLKLVAYSNADLAVDLNDRHSITACCFSLSRNVSVVSWKSKKQQTVALSTCEYMALSATAQESLYLTNACI